MFGSASARDPLTSGLEGTALSEGSRACECVVMRDMLANLATDLREPATSRAMASQAVVVGALPSSRLQPMHAVVEASRTCSDHRVRDEASIGFSGLATERGSRVFDDAGVAPEMSTRLVGWEAGQLGACAPTDRYEGGFPAERCQPFEYNAGVSCLDDA